MNDIDPGLKTILESAVPTGAEAVGDWEDVLRRADVPQAGDGKVVRFGRRPRRRVWYGLAAAAVVTGLLVNPAFGVGDRILDWFRGSPAPEHVKDELRGMNAPEEVRAFFQGPGVRADEARGVMAIETSRGRAYLWAAPTEAGGWCTVVQLPETQSVGMGTAACDVGPPAHGLLAVGGGTDLSGDEPFTLLEGRVEPPIVSLELRFADGSTESVPFVEHFFIYEVPAGRDPSAIVGRDAQGEIVARQTIQVAEEEPPGGQEQTGEAASLRRLIEIKTSTGSKARLLVGDEATSGDERCYELEAEKNKDYWAGSFCPTPTGRVVTYAADPVQRQEPLVLLHGFVAPRVASLELRFEDGETVPLRLAEGFFLYELPRSHYSEGHLPSILIARDRAGQVIEHVAAIARR